MNHPQLRYGREIENGYYFPFALLIWKLYNIPITYHCSGNT